MAGLNANTHRADIMNLKTMLSAAAAGLLIGLLAVPLASRANANSDIARRSCGDCQGR
ncbi:hypothetical protein [Cyanobium sp. ATX 6E8]|uniref:hypothetical protein n=1 Tax=Cyanobium sp. ATX 6E8 TaxID=2823701 RepID=UPI0020CBDF56|nr:hypothetical protein [Cyanobium sp. ATX 6E8]